MSNWDFFLVNFDLNGIYSIIRGNGYRGYIDQKRVIIKKLKSI